MISVTQPLINRDMQTLTPEEKPNFIIALKNLKQAIGDMQAAEMKENPGKNRACKSRELSVIH